MNRWRRGEGVTAAASIDLIPAGTPLACTYPQQRIWFLENLEPGSSVHNLAFALRLTGALDLEILENALLEIAQRHEASRTVFPTVDGQPVPTVQPSPVRGFELVDSGSLDFSADEGLERQVRETAREPFDIARDELVRVRLFRLGEAESVMVVVAHHIVSDGWSMGVFLNELFALYAAFAAGHPSPLPPLPIQYGDYAHWQAQQAGSDSMRRQIDHWRHQLRGELPVLELPTDRPRPVVESTRGGAQQVEIPVPLIDRLKAVCSQTGATPFMALVAAYGALLHRYTGADEVCIGTPVANRPLADTEALIGVFINTVVLRLDLSGNPSFRELIGRVRDATTRAFENQEVPFERLVEELRPQRDFGRAPLFQTMFVFRSSPVPSQRLPGLTTRRYPVDNGASRFDMSLLVEQEQEQFFSWLEYKIDLFDPATMAQIARDYRRLLEAMVDDPVQTIGDAPLLLTEDRERLARLGTGAPLPSGGALLHEQVAAQAASSPEAIAVVCGREELRYGALDVAAEALARRLRAAGVGPSVPVPVLVERSTSTVIAILGVLKAGGAYVPLDPTTPPARLGAILRELQPPVVVASPELARDLPLEGARLLAPRSPAPDAGEAAESLPRVDAEGLAYIIYTSGSTGGPKGVEVSHANLISSTAARAAFYGAEVKPRFLLLSSFGFDSSVAGLFWTLGQGGALVIPAEDARLDVPHLAEIIRDRAVTHVLTLPSVYRLLVEHAPALGSLRDAIVAGEACPVELVARHHELLPTARLLNEYGPTEGTVWAAVHECLPEPGCERVPIGRPIAGAQIYLLDARLQPVPAGVIGDLWIGGPGVARGYARRPDLTAAAFQADLQGPPGARRYCTGDRARFRLDGALEFWGRRDHQVKLRGHRIELEEIEARLCAHPGVEDAAAAVHADRDGGLMLVAYVVPRDVDAGLAAALREWVASALPGYMVPSIFEAVPALPRTVTGKLARGALPAPTVLAVASRAAYAPADTSLQRVVAEVWKAALGVERVGIDDNFFELGGHSFLVMQVHAKLTQQLEKELPVVILFRYPTVRSLAAHLGEHEDATAPADRTEALRSGRQRLIQRGNRARQREGE